jgi:hypothetical protein
MANETSPAEQKPKTVLLYTAAATIDDTIKVALIEAGYIPIQVTDQSAVRLIPLPGPHVPRAQLDVITATALETIASYSQGPSQDFGNKLARRPRSRSATPQPRPRIRRTPSSR